MKSILVIEDDEDLRELAGIMLEQQGYDVDFAANGREGLARVRQRMPDLILLDIKMPVMSGAEFATEYRTHYAEHSRAPVIVMTAADHASRRSKEIGANDFLSKPFSMDDLLRTVKKHVFGPTSRAGIGGGMSRCWIPKAEGSPPKTSEPSTTRVGEGTGRGASGCR